MFTDRKYLRLEQYRDSGNLNARIALHKRFSTNPYGWFRWVFDHLDLPSHSRILELGCGAGNLWTENLVRLTNQWDICLSDFSTGMLAQTRHKLLEYGDSGRFVAVDAQSIPFPEASVDAVIANHMLYHVPDKDLALEEIRRVLKPAGRLFAATNGADHLQELDELILKVDPGFVSHTANLSFNLENGGDFLGKYFRSVELDRYPDALEVTETDPLVAYVVSMIGMGVSLRRERLENLTHFVDDEITRHGAFHITKSACLFICQ